MALKRQLKHLKSVLIPETIRDYSDITKLEDCISAQLKRKSNQFRFELTCMNEEHEAMCFKIPLTPSILSALKEIVDDIRRIRKSKNEKQMRLRIRQGEFDLVVTYHFTSDQSMKNQRTAPLTSRNYKLLEEMLADAKTLIPNEADDISEE